MIECTKNGLEINGGASEILFDLARIVNGIETAFSSATGDAAVSRKLITHSVEFGLSQMDSLKKTAKVKTERMPDAGGESIGLDILAKALARAQEILDQKKEAETNGKD